MQKHGRTVSQAIAARSTSTSRPLNARKGLASRVGAEIQAIRGDEEAGALIGFAQDKGRKEPLKKANSLP